MLLHTVTACMNQPRALHAMSVQVPHADVPGHAAALQLRGKS